MLRLRNIFILLLVIIILGIPAQTLAQDDIIELPDLPNVSIGSDLVVIIAILSLTTVSGISVWRNSGGVKSLESTIERLITNRPLAAAVEDRLSRLPQSARETLTELTDLLDPLSERTELSKAAQLWIKNMLDGDPSTGAVNITASGLSTPESPPPIS